MKLANINLPLNSRIICDDCVFEDNIEIGEDVVIECKRLRLGKNVKIGLKTEQNFRNIAGIRINVKELNIDNDTTICREIMMNGGCINIGSNCYVGELSTINVKKFLKLGNNGVLGKNFTMNGVDIEIGDYFWSNTNVEVGGGGCFEIYSKLRIGYWCHLGRDTFINTSRLVSIGNEVGMRGNLYTHGAYQSMLNGYTVQFGEIYIGDNCWLPSATVHPSVRIGKNTVIAGGSVVITDIPDGSLAAGIPAKVIRRDIYPRKLSSEEREEVMFDFMKVLSEVLSDEFDMKFEIKNGTSEILLNNSIAIIYKDVLNEEIIETYKEKELNRMIFVSNSFTHQRDLENSTFIGLKERQIKGKSDNLSERLLNQLRRHGVRFKFRSIYDRYERWQ